MSSLSVAQVAADISHIRSQELEVLRRVDEYTRHVRAAAAIPQRREVVDLLSRAAQSLAEAFHALDLAERTCSEGTADGRSPSADSGNALTTVTTKFRAVEGNRLVSIVFHSSGNISLEPSRNFDCIDPLLREVFFEKPIGLQSFLLPMLTRPQTVVYVDEDVPFPQRPHSGFKIASLFSAATLLLKDRREQNPSHALVVVAQPEHVMALVEYRRVIPKNFVFVAATLDGERLLTDPQDTPPDTSSTIFLCTSACVRRLPLDKIAYVFWDGFNDESLFHSVAMPRLKSVFLRGPSNLAETVLLPKSFRIRAHLWTSTRQVTTLPVHAFSAANEVEPIIQDLVREKTTAILTARPNAYVQGASIVKAPNLVPNDAECVIVLDVPPTVEQLAETIQAISAPHVVVIYPQQAVELLYGAFTALGLPLTSELKALQYRKEQQQQAAVNASQPTSSASPLFGQPTAAPSMGGALPYLPQGEGSALLQLGGLRGPSSHAVGGINSSSATSLSRPLGSRDGSPSVEAPMGPSSFLSSVAQLGFSHQPSSLIMSSTQQQQQTTLAASQPLSLMRY